MDCDTNARSSTDSSSGTSQPPSEGPISGSDELHSHLVIHDPIYGQVIIESACALEIMQLSEFQRLKKVLQHGITGLIGCVPEPPVNRFDHSVGAMILVKEVGGSEEAQLAALLHDVAHTALSHVLDLVYGYVIHEVEKELFLDSTTIREVLMKYGFDPQRVLHEENFPLLELPKPDLCADRLDYALRDSVAFGFLSIEDAHRIFRSIIVIDGQMVLNSVSSALMLVNAYMACDQYSWANPTHEYLYQLAAEAIRLSLREGTIEKPLLWQLGDADFWSRLTHKADAPDLQNLLKKIDKTCEVTELKPDHEAAGAMTCCLKLRVRTIDPLVKTPDQGAQRLSLLDPAFCTRRQQYIKSRELPQTFVVKHLYGL